jgi:hypothetical protein
VLTVSCSVIDPKGKELGYFGPFCPSRSRDLDVIEAVIGRRRSKLLAAAAVAGFFALASPAGAATPSIIGFGSVSGGCGEWLAAEEKSAKDIWYISWILGFISGVNVLNNAERSVDFAHDYSGYSMIPWVRNWCQQHPLDPVASGAEALAITLMSRIPKTQ